MFRKLFVKPIITNAFKINTLKQIAIGTTAGVALYSLQTNLFAKTRKPAKFDLQNQIPQAKDAKQVLFENPEIPFIGVYNCKTKELTLMPALPRYIEFSYDKDGKIIKGYNNKTNTYLIEEELNVMRLLIPRRGHYGTSHSTVLSHMRKVNDNIDKMRSDLFGCTVTLTHNTGVLPHAELIGISYTLNSGKPGAIEGELPPCIREEIQMLLDKWIVENNGATRGIKASFMQEETVNEITVSLGYSI